MKDLWRSPVVRLLAVLLALALAIRFMVSLRGVITPFVVSFAIAYFLNPLVNALEGLFQRVLPRGRRGTPAVHPRTLAVCLLFVVVVGVLVVVIVFGVPAAVHQASFAVSKIPENVLKLRDKLEPRLARLSERYPQQAEEIRARIEGFAQDNTGEIVGRVTHFVQTTVLGTLAVVLSVFGLLVVPIFTLYLLYDMNQIREEAKKLVPERFRPYLYSRMRLIDQRLAAFARGQLTICLIMAVFYAIAFSIYGVPMALVMGALCGMFHVIPFLSTVVGLPLGGLLALIDSGSFSHAGLVVGTMAVGQFIEANVLSPRIVGHGVGLHAVVVILAVLVGGELFGILGMLAAVPIVASLSVFWDDLRDLYLRSSFYRGAPENGT